DPREGVVSKAVDALDAAALQAAIAGHDVVISAAHFATLPASAVVGPVKKAGVKRLLVVGGAGSLLLPDDTRVIDSEGFPEAYKAEASAGAEFLASLREERDLDWTFLSPSAEFVEGERTGKFRLGQDDLLVSSEGRSWITFADYAIAMLDEVEAPKHSRQRFTVGY
ncbi:MAG: NAD(P)H-binding protein, partial [Pseudomonas fluorescens]|nr:NAD(P)H-binding protein [Pseudomonas fluorescens]